MSRTPIRKALAALTAGAAAAAAFLVAPADADARKSPLEGQPAVRHKFEFRDKRFELAPTFEASVGAEYQHTLSGGVKLEFHLTDSLSVGGAILFGAALDTGLLEEIRGSLPSDPGPPYPTPNQRQVNEHINQMPLH